MVPSGLLNVVSLLHCLQSYARVIYYGRLTVAQCMSAKWSQVDLAIMSQTLKDYLFQAFNELMRVP